MPDVSNLAAWLNERLIGQQEAIAEFSAAIELATIGPVRERRPLAFILMLGPTGTGKTEMVNLTAEFLYGAQWENRVARFDMGEYTHADATKRLQGSPDQKPLLGEAIDRLNAQGGGFLLLDEIEKSFADLQKVLLSFDNGRTTMFDGETKNLSRIMVVLTSNLGAADAARMEESGYNEIRQKMIYEAERKFAKETVARFSSVIVMNTLTYPVQETITRNLLGRELALQAAHYHRLIEADSTVLPFLINRGFTPDLGARNIRKTVEKYIGGALKPYAFLKQADDPSDRPGTVGDLWSRALLITTEGDSLAAWPLPRSEKMKLLLASLAA
jgi:ATP-dependent Clp protease ATP-binding subunit ClpA